MEFDELFDDTFTATSKRKASPSNDEKRVKKANSDWDADNKDAVKVDEAKGMEVEATSDATIESDTNATGTTSEECIDEIEMKDEKAADFVPAKIYPFKLDTFQQDAVNYIEKSESVLVAAHTSAGKTVVAEYAIAKSLRDKQRVIYTSPIKALSNQKYRDMEAEFGDVGLMTGDMTINPNAACLIMTTEILRSMLYRGSEVMREVAWVIYDEVHYMRDKERGVVWEESIILLPHNVRFVFLSATIPNAKDFVAWVSKLHHQPCHVVYTDYRPVPLQHFLYPQGADGLYLVVDEKGNFKDDSFQKAMNSFQSEEQAMISRSSNGKKNNKRMDAKSRIGNDLQKIIRLIMDRDLDPCIVFSFSKKDCEQYALQISRLDFNSHDEKKLIEQVFENAMASLSEDDRNLPQVVTILPLLKRGIGIHHGGLLPVLKEVLELLFQEGLIKCLFATETFSIGINMPAKTVVFTSTKKFDGEDFRYITSGEYIQMSGRAGRRGKDTKGIVIQMIGEKVPHDVTKNMIYGSSDPLHSSYHVSYNMVLNMSRVEDADPENLLKSSFHQFQQELETPKFLAKAEELQEKAKAIDIKFYAPQEVAGYCAVTNQLDKVNEEICNIVVKSSKCLPYLQAGRHVHVKCDGLDWGWGAIVNYHDSGDRKFNVNEPILGYDPRLNRKKKGTLASNSKNGKKVKEERTYVVEVLLTVKDIPEDVEGLDLSAYSMKHGIIPWTTEDDETEQQNKVIYASLSTITQFSAAIFNLPKELNEHAKRGVMKAVRKVPAKFEDKGGIPLLDPIDDMGIEHEGFTALIAKSKEIQDQLSKHSFVTEVTNKAEQKSIIASFKKQAAILTEAKAFLKQANTSQAVAMREDLRRMKKVLSKLEYVDADGVLGAKGRFCCELTTGDELVLTDMIFDGVFNELSPEQAVSLLSCFIHKEQSQDEGNIPSNLKPAFQKLQSTARTVAKASINAKISLDEDEYVSSFNPIMMEVTYAWSTGAKFIDICNLTDIFEGSIIRNMRRLDELLRQLAAACMAIGNQELKALFEEGGNKIRRGVIFSASLYI